MADDSLGPWLHDMPDLTADSRFELGLDCLLDGVRPPPALKIRPAQAMATTPKASSPATLSTSSPM